VHKDMIPCHSTSAEWKATP